MKAMILAAGFGTRLRPLTDHRPKALVPVGDRPLLDYNVEYLRRHGAEAVVINAHHKAAQLEAYAGAKEWGIPVSVRIEKEILGTGGGIRNTADFWDDEPFIVLNGDILTDIDLRAAYRAHCEAGRLASLVLHACESYSQVAVDAEGNIVDIAAAPRPGRLAFTGIHVLDPRLIDKIPGPGFADIVACYRCLIMKGGGVGAFLSTGHRWRDLGSIPEYLAANRDWVGLRRVFVGPGAQVHPSVRFEDWAVVGAGAVLEAEAVVGRSVLWEGVSVAAGIEVLDSIVTAGRRIERPVCGATR